MSNWCLSGGGAASYQASLISMESRFFGACDSSTIYPLRGSPYFAKQTTSARPAERNVGIVAGILMSLTEDFQGSGRNVICDNYFTDLKLAEFLAKTKLTMIGTKHFSLWIFKRKRLFPWGNQSSCSEIKLLCYPTKTKDQKMSCYLAPCTAKLKLWLRRTTSLRWFLPMPYSIYGANKH